MTTAPRAAERRITAYIDNDESRNIIHSAAAAERYGYEGALVTGVVTYGWAVPAIIESLGESWLHDGWTDMRFRRAVYDGDEVLARVSEVGDGDDGAFSLEVFKQDDELCVVGAVGPGKAEWFDELPAAPRRDPVPPLEQRPPLTLADAPIGQELRPMAVTVTREEAAAIAGRVRDTDARWSGERALIHPQWLASQMYQLLLHSYEFYPSMHVRSQLQHLAPARAGQTLTLAARFVEAYERKVHHYATLEGSIFAEDGQELVRVRYSTVFHIAERT